MSELPVWEKVLYKHGVGFFVREGGVSGDKVALTFRQDEINDVLKSLVVFDKAALRSELLLVTRAAADDGEAKIDVHANCAGIVDVDV